MTRHEFEVKVKRNGESIRRITADIRGMSERQYHITSGFEMVKDHQGNAKICPKRLREIISMGEERWYEDVVYLRLCISRPDTRDCQVQSNQLAQPLKAIVDQMFRRSALFALEMWFRAEEAATGFREFVVPFLYARIETRLHDGRHARDRDGRHLYVGHDLRRWEEARWKGRPATSDFYLGFPPAKAKNQGNGQGQEINQSIDETVSSSSLLDSNEQVSHSPPQQSMLPRTKGKPSKKERNKRYAQQSRQVLANQAADWDRPAIPTNRKQRLASQWNAPTPREYQFGRQLQEFETTPPAVPEFGFKILLPSTSNAQSPAPPQSALDKPTQATSEIDTSPAVDKPIFTPVRGGGFGFSADEKMSLGDEQMADQSQIPPAVEQGATEAEHNVDWSAWDDASSSSDDEDSRLTED